MSTIKKDDRRVMPLIKARVAVDPGQLGDEARISEASSAAVSVELAHDYSAREAPS